MQENATIPKNNLKPLKSFLETFFKQNSKEAAKNSRQKQFEISLNWFKPVQDHSQTKLPREGMPKHSSPERNVYLENLNRRIIWLISVSLIARTLTAEEFFYHCENHLIEPLWSRYGTPIEASVK